MEVKPLAQIALFLNPEFLTFLNEKISKRDCILFVFTVASLFATPVFRKGLLACSPHCVHTSLIGKPCIARFHIRSIRSGNKIYLR